MRIEPVGHIFHNLLLIRVLYDFRVIDVLAMIGLLLPAVSVWGVEEEKEGGGNTNSEWAAKRQEIFEFKQRPQVHRNEDRVEITFEPKAYCDATVVIEDSKGMIVRYLACGLLGDRAPLPFKPGVLKQTIIWDGKDDFGAFIDDKDAFSVRVSLGLKAGYEKELYYHPKRRVGNWTEIKAGPDGVYVYEFNTVDFLRKFDHDGNYVSTIHPFPANKLEQVKGLGWQTVPLDGIRVPLKNNEYGTSLLPQSAGLYDTDPPMSAMAVYGKQIALFGNPRLLRLSDDGTTGGLEITGPKCRPACPAWNNRPYPGAALSAAFSPEGEWVYLASFRFFVDERVGHNVAHGIYRMPFNGPQEPKLFIGTDKAGDTKEQFRDVGGIDVDSKGRIYVADWSHDEVKVFTPDGKFFKSIQVAGPARVRVHKKTQEIYVVTYLLAPHEENYCAEPDRSNNRKWNDRARKPMLRKFAPIENPDLRLEAPMPNIPYHWETRVELDSWSSTPRLWLFGEGWNYGSGVVIYEEKDGKLALFKNFDDEVRKAGMEPRKAWFQRQFLFFDSKREVLWCGEPDGGEMKIFQSAVAIDVNSGTCKTTKLPAGAADAAFDARGLCYLRVGDAVSRYDPTTWREVPYDYGEDRTVASSVSTSSARTLSAISTPGGGGSSVKYGSMGVSPRGEVVVSCVYGYSPSSEKASTQAKALTGGTKKWSPVLYPGRPQSLFIHVYDEHGELKHEDILKGIGLVTGGLSMDWQGNVYAQVRSERLLGSKVQAPHTGALGKFGPGEGVFKTTDHPMLPLDKAPAKTQEVAGAWVDGAKWFFGGGSQGSTNHCWCRHAKFSTDYLGRCFVPEPWRYDIAVLDTNGNLILRIGRYGNADSTGPKSAIPLGGDEIGLADAHYVATHTDKRLFISDVGNARIVSARLDYHVTERVALKDVPDQGKTQP